MLRLARAAGAAETVQATGSVWLAGEDEVDALTGAVTAMSGAGIRCRIDMDALPDRLRRWYRLAAVVEADGSLLPAEWVRVLARTAAAAGAAIYEHSPVSAIAPDANGWTSDSAGRAHRPRPHRRGRMRRADPGAGARARPGRVSRAGSGARNRTVGAHGHHPAHPLRPRLLLLPAHTGRPGGAGRRPHHRHGRRVHRSGSRPRRRFRQRWTRSWRSGSASLPPASPTAGRGSWASRPTCCR